MKIRQGFVLVIFLLVVSFFGYKVDSLTVTRERTTLPSCHKSVITSLRANKVNSDSSSEDINERRKARRKSNRQKVDKIQPAIAPTKSLENRLSDISSSTTKEVSIEEKFGLGENQLRELMDIELPVPREELITGKVMKPEDENNDDKVFRLPDLSEFLTDKKEKDEKRANAAPVDDRVDRRDSDEYLRLLKLNPFADADETLFVQEYDIIQSLFGAGKLLGIPIPYLQAGHGMLLVILLLSSNVYYPGNPLTELPLEIRMFLKQSLSVVFGINAVLAVQSFFIARSKHIPSLFWAIKTLIFGGLAFFEVSQAEDPTKIKPPTPRKNKPVR